MTTLVTMCQKTQTQETQNNIVKVWFCNHILISEMIFLLIFFVTNVSSQQLTLYDNSVQALMANSPISNAEPCIIQKTEHFSLKDDVVIPGKLSLQSTRLIKNIMDHLKFLLDVEKPIFYYDTGKKWAIIRPLKKVFKYTPLDSDLFHVTNACHPFLLFPD